MHYITVPTLLLEGDITRATKNPCTGAAVFDLQLKGLREMRPSDAEGIPMPLYHCTRPEAHVDSHDPVHIAHGVQQINAAWIETDGSPSELATFPFTLADVVADACMALADAGVNCTRAHHHDPIHLASTLEGVVVYAWLEASEDMAVEA